jgi:hypothetical protein
MDDNDALDQSLSDLIGSSAPTIADEDGALGQIVHRAHGRVMRRRVVASGVTMALVAAVAIAVVVAGQRPDRIRVQGHPDLPSTTAPESTTTTPASTTTTAAPESTTTEPSSTTSTSTSTSTPSPPPTTPSVDRALDLISGTAFGIQPGDVLPETVLSTLTPVLGPPTRDTGWYIAELHEGGDCFGNQRHRILRWGNLSFGFHNPPEHPERFILWGWALGPDENMREPQPIVDTTPLAATTPDGVGIGTSLEELRAVYGERVQEIGKSVFMTISNGGILFTVTDGKVSVIESRLPFC